MLPLITSVTEQPSDLIVKIRYLGQSTVTKLVDPVSGSIEILRIVKELTQKGHRVYIHCARGEDRTGVIVGLLRKCESWKSEFKTYGGSYYSSLKWLFEKVEPHSAKF